MKLVLAEKPSVAQSIAKVLGAAKREDGYLEGNGYVVSWCVGHLVELAQPEAYDAPKSNPGNFEGRTGADTWRTTGRLSGSPAGRKKHLVIPWPVKRNGI